MPMQAVGTHAQEMEWAIHLQCSARMLWHQSSPRQDGRIEHDVDRITEAQIYVECVDSADGALLLPEEGV